MSEELAAVQKTVAALDERLTALETMLRTDLMLRLSGVEGHVNRLDEDTAITAGDLAALEKFVRSMDEAVVDSLDILEEAIGSRTVSAAGRRLKQREAAK